MDTPGALGPATCHEGNEGAGAPDTQRKAESCLAWGREGPGGSYPCIQTPEGMCVEGSQILLTDAQYKGKRQRAQIETWEMSKITKTPFYCERGQTWEPVAQRGCGASILADIQNTTRHNPEQPALTNLLFLCAKIRKHHQVNLTKLLKCINV